MEKPEFIGLETKSWYLLSYEFNVYVLFENRARFSIRSLTLPCRASASIFFTYFPVLNKCLGAVPCDMRFYGGLRWPNTVFKYLCLIHHYF